MIYLRNAGIAQLVEQLSCKQQARGSNPCVGTMKGERNYETVER